MKASVTLEAMRRTDSIFVYDCSSVGRPDIESIFQLRSNAIFYAVN